MSVFAASQPNSCPLQLEDRGRTILGVSDYDCKATLWIQLPLRNRELNYFLFEYLSVAKERKCPDIEAFGGNEMQSIETRYKRNCNYSQLGVRDKEPTYAY